MCMTMSRGDFGLREVPVALLAPESVAPFEEEPNAWYDGLCPVTGELLRLPRTLGIEKLSMRLRTELDDLGLEEGKMFGLLVVQDREGRLGYGKAFSGLLNGQADLEGWAPPFHVRQVTALEVETLKLLDEKKSQIGELAQKLASHRYPSQSEQWNVAEAAMKSRHQANREDRRRMRVEDPLADLRCEALSRQDSLERRDFRRQREEALSALRADFQGLQADSRSLRSERKAHSRNLQQEMHQAFCQSASTDLGCSVESLFSTGIPTGTGDCCAPKLLAWAIRQRLKPLAMAEFWWGPTSVGGRIAGQFYAACRTRCQPLLGPLLRRASNPSLEVVYEDDEVLALEKPSGLLTTPGRHSWNQDSLLSRSRQERDSVLPVHRLDFETSGLVLFAKTPEAQAHLRRQFEKRSISKMYQALLEGLPRELLGRITSPLLRDNDKRPTYRIHPQGQPAHTEYRVLDATTHRIELRPLTGRSHQLRVHMAESLGCPIQGDRLYGTQRQGTQGRLALHACRLEFTHPKDGIVRWLESPVPF